MNPLTAKPYLTQSGRIKDVAALSFPRRLAAVNNVPELSSPPVKPYLQPDDILAAPADGVAAGGALPSSRFRGISSPAI